MPQQQPKSASKQNIMRIYSGCLVVLQEPNSSYECKRSVELLATWTFRPNFDHEPMNGRNPSVNKASKQSLILANLVWMMHQIEASSLRNADSCRAHFIARNQIGLQSSPELNLVVQTTTTGQSSTHQNRKTMVNRCGQRLTTTKFLGARIIKLYGHIPSNRIK